MQVLTTPVRSRCARIERRTRRAYKSDLAYDDYEHCDGGQND